FGRNPAPESSCLAVARAVAVECARKILHPLGGIWLEYAGNRRAPFARPGFDFADRPNCVERLALFFDGDCGADSEGVASEVRRAGAGSKEQGGREGEGRARSRN